ncbi:golgin subfamily A member 4-like isoform X2 [Uranotaenia lowii]|uniref:golgin subfamily A member 4-like isoform X2 n=1 Tax=Uranotaenia lowii TaxID=190385 RepID=UPI0024795286|nr:golgin subfamily A member 4-like isoform X2 [Uranotaenia lowii]XP_055614482.1 golgin subfamily A member 4-like isoform X2 [Uranotaenia lowii]
MITVRPKRKLLQEAEDRLAEAQEQLEIRETTIKSYERQINELSSNVVSLESEIESLRDQNNNLLEDLEATKELCSKLDLQKDKLKAELDEHSQIREQLNKENATLKRQLSLAKTGDKAAVDGLQELLAGSRSEVEQQRIVTSQLNRELKTLKEQVEDLSTKLDEEHGRAARNEALANEYSVQLQELRRIITDDRFAQVHSREEEQDYNRIAMYMEHCATEETSYNKSLTERNLNDISNLQSSESHGAFHNASNITMGNEITTFEQKNYSLEKYLICKDMTEGMFLEENEQSSVIDTEKYSETSGLKINESCTFSDELEAPNVPYPEVKTSINGKRMKTRRMSSKQETSSLQSSSSEENKDVRFKKRIEVNIGNRASEDSTNQQDSILRTGNGSKNERVYSAEALLTDGDRILDVTQDVKTLLGGNANGSSNSFYSTDSQLRVAFNKIMEGSNNDAKQTSLNEQSIPIIKGSIPMISGIPSNQISHRRDQKENEVRHKKAFGKNRNLSIEDNINDQDSYRRTEEGSEIGCIRSSKLHQNDGDSNSDVTQDEHNSSLDDNNDPKQCSINMRPQQATEEILEEIHIGPDVLEITPMHEQTIAVSEDVTPISQVPQPKNHTVNDDLRSKKPVKDDEDNRVLENGSNQVLTLRNVSYSENGSIRSAEILQTDCILNTTRDLSNSQLNNVIESNYSCSIDMRLQRATEMILRQLNTDSDNMKSISRHEQSIPMLEDRMFSSRISTPNDSTAQASQRSVQQVDNGKPLQRKRKENDHPSGTTADKIDEHRSMIVIYKNTLGGRFNVPDNESEFDWPGKEDSISNCRSTLPATIDDFQRFKTPIRTLDAGMSQVSSYFPEKSWHPRRVSKNGVPSAIGTNESSTIDVKSRLCKERKWRQFLRLIPSPAMASQHDDRQKQSKKAPHPLVQSLGVNDRITTMNYSGKLKNGKRTTTNANSSSGSQCNNFKTDGTKIRTISAKIDNGPYILKLNFKIPSAKQNQQVKKQ